MHAAFFAVFIFAIAVMAKDIVITVGLNAIASDPSKTFTPQRVEGKIGDNVIFNFTSGNHSVTQSTFGSPCIPAHITNSSINGFDSGLRPTNNGTAITTLSVPITPDNVGAPLWFYDASIGACGEGAVGVINSDESGNETLAGFERNAIRLNGSEENATTSYTSSTGSITRRPTATATQASSSAARPIIVELIIISAVFLTTIVIL
ncbi:hypothetical protein BD410DRAFT_791434 [Rickenella mellea]|uniref:Cupredoxin n=1 Tax=Rickenella mellea TaxID=50990 RepID=A0A4Y7PXC9_9AGAM|nr:hypothetical protein BD410DRAFT_791434 [Rickenella mellea]